MSKIKLRLIIVMLIAIVILLLFKFFGFDSLSLEFITKNSHELEALVDNNIYYSLFLYTLFYVLFLSIGAPIGAIMSVVAGYFFGNIIGIIAVFPAAMISAAIVFLLGNKILNQYVKDRYNEKITDIEEELDRYGFYYVLATRLSSILPYFLTNLLFGASGISWKNFFLPTFLGLIPGTVIYVNIGASLKTIDSFEGILDFKLIFLFILLGLLALIPIIIKHLVRRKKNV